MTDPRPHQLASSPSSVSPKVAASSAASAVAVIALWLLSLVVTVPDQVAVAVAVLVVTACTWAAGYLRTDPARGGAHRAAPPR